MHFLDDTRKKILIIYASVIAAGILYALIINLAGHGLPCMFREITGLMCPGCGSSRMFLAATRGDFSLAFAYNPAAFISFPSWVFISALAFAGKPRVFRNSRFLLGCLYVTVATYLILCVVRNIMYY